MDMDTHVNSAFMHNDTVILQSAFLKHFFLCKEVDKLPLGSRG